MPVCDCGKSYTGARCPFCKRRPGMKRSESPAENDRFPKTGKVQLGVVSHAPSSTTARPLVPQRQEAPPQNILFMPGNYSGDLWHIAAALVVDESFQAAITILEDVLNALQSETTGSTSTNFSTLSKRNGPINAQLYLYLQQLGLRDRVRYLPVSQLHQSWSHGLHYTARTLAEQLKASRQRFRLGMTWSSTSAILHAILENAGGGGISQGRQAVIQKLRGALDLGISEEQHQFVANKVKAITQGASGKVILVNMRASDNHLQHNSDRSLYEQIHTEATKRGFMLRQVDDISGATVKKVKFDWVTQYDAHPIDVFSTFNTDVPRGDKREVAHFWKLVADDPNIFGVVGGRSGSLDIAAFMGVNVLCWDILPGNSNEAYEFERLLTSLLLLSVVIRGGTETAPEPTLDPEGLVAWLEGQRVNPRYIFTKKGALDTISPVSPDASSVQPTTSKNSKRTLFFPMSFIKQKQVTLKFNGTSTNLGVFPVIEENTLQKLGFQEETELSQVIELQLALFASFSQHRQERQEQERHSIRQTLEQRFQVLPVTGDGNCLFRALAMHLGGTQFRHAQARTDAVEHMRAHPELFSAIDPNITGDYLETMATPARNALETERWGGHPELYALSRAYRTRIIVHVDATTTIPIAEELDPRFAPLPRNADIHLYFAGGNHYELMRPRTGGLRLQGAHPSSSTL